MITRPERTLNGVLACLHQPSVWKDIVVTDLTLDSRHVGGGEVFIAVPGLRGDGRRFIQDATRQGVAAILFDSSDGLHLADFVEDVGIAVSGKERKGGGVCPVIPVSGLKEKIAMLADWFYDRPSENIKVMGVTGTNGKTSCCWYLSQILEYLGEPCALMGTLGQGRQGSIKACQNTTSDAISLQQYFAELVMQSVHAVAMEVSSHGLEQGRVAGVTFETVLFTHISRDHLDYHGSLNAYAAAKSRLFSEHMYRYAVIGIDDVFSELMLNSCKKSADIITWSLIDQSADVFATDLQVHSRGFTAKIHSPWGSDQLQTTMLGRFNLANLLAVVAVLGVQGYSLSDVIEAVSSLSSPPGRMQVFGGGCQPLVLVDYSHTPDAIKSALSSLREHGARRLVCVYGCGGDRDSGKRPLMTLAALQGSDRVVLTSDNPRSENPGKIISDALKGISCEDQARIHVEPDRREAITFAIEGSEQDDIVLVAGKGHETYQEVNGIRHHFDDREQVQRALARRQKL